MITLVTVSFLVIFSSLIGLLAFIDMFIYKSNIFYPLLTILRLNPGTNKWMVFASVGIGFVYSIMVDFRIKKNKKMNEQS